MIGVTGASGTIGGELVELLIGQGAPVRAIGRNPPRKAAPGVEVMRADLADPEALPRAFAGCRTLFLVTGNSADMVRLQKNAIRAAARSGVGSIVKVSALGATDHSRSIIGLWHYNVERVLKESGLRWTLLRPHHFMQNFLDPLVFDRSEGSVRSTAGDGAIPFVDTRDVAAVAAAVLLDGSHAGTTLTLTGPAAHSYREASGQLASVLDRPIRFVAETEDEAWRRRRAAGQPAWLAAAQLALAEYQRAGGPTERTTDTIERITGRPAGTLRRFFEDHAEALSPGR